MLARFNVVSKVGGEIIDFEKLVELDNDGWRIITIVGDVNRTITHGAPQWALCQKSDNMVVEELGEELGKKLGEDVVKAPAPDPALDEDSSPVQPRVAVSASQEKSVKEANKPKPKKKGYKYGGMVKKDKYNG